jgi:pimeloyl-ACP methyl ester carboxylesterase
MRSWILSPLVFAAIAGAALLSDPAFGLAQSKPGDPEEVSFQSADGVKLKGLYYKSVKGGNSPTAILLHGYATDPNKGDWDALARKLALDPKTACNVLRFDFRGHGKSTDVNPNVFWSPRFAVNARNIKGGSKVPPRGEISYKDFQKDYFPVLVNDIVAARHFLDLKNDANECNTSSIFVIGDKYSAALGMMWIASEWKRAGVAVGFPMVGGQAPPLAGKDIAGAVWLSIEKPQSFPSNVYQTWVNNVAPDMRLENPMVFFYADKDTRGAENARYFLDQVLVANPKGGKLSKLPLTKGFPVKGGDKLAGVDLLGKGSLNTETLILQAVEAIEKDRGQKGRIERKYNQPPYLDPKQVGVPVQ